MICAVIVLPAVHSASEPGIATIVTVTVFVVTAMPAIAAMPCESAIGKLTIALSPAAAPVTVMAMSEVPPSGMAPKLFRGADPV